MEKMKEGREGRKGEREGGLVERKELFWVIRCFYCHYSTCSLSVENSSTHNEPFP